LPHVSYSKSTWNVEEPVKLGAVVLPFVTWAVIAVLALSALGYVAITHLNDLDRASQRHLATTALTLERDRLETLTSEYSWWDVAIEELFPIPNEEWIEENIGLHAHGNLDINLTVVVGSGDRVHVAYRDKEYIELNPDFAQFPDIQHLIREARASPMDPLKTTSGFAEIMGHVYILGVGAFSPEIPPEGAAPDPTRPVLIYGRRIGEPFLETQATNFGFKELRATAASEPHNLVITSPTGVALAGLAWKAGASGTELTTRLIIPAIAVLTILGILAGFFLRRAQDMSKALASAADVTSLRNEQLRRSESEAVRSQSLAEQASAEKERALVELRKRNDELLVARHDAMQASQAKTMFLASMSHELRTPLNAIIGFSEILKDQRFGPLGSDRYVDYADNIRTSDTHLLSLINDVLDISKIEAGKMSIEPEPVSMNDLVTSTLRLFMEQAHLGGVSISSDLDARDITIQADPRAIRQILVDLLANALKFTSPGDEISVTTKSPQSKGEKAEKTENDRMAIVVSDTGPGIPAEFQDAIFLPFNRGPEISDKDGGTGLGLALVKALTELHDGQVTLKSDKGAGTTVTVELPIGSAKEDKRTD
jgi:signal transduction histidine kinase